MRVLALITGALILTCVSANAEAHYPTTNNSDLYLEHLYIERVASSLLESMKLSDKSSCANKEQVMNAAPRTLIEQNTALNAFSIYEVGSNGTLLITSGLLNETRSVDEMAFVIGHELAHWCRKQPALPEGLILSGKAWDRLIGIRQDLELKADHTAIWAMHQAGYDVNVIPQFLSRLESKLQPKKHLESHPSTSSRLKLIKEQILALASSSN